MVSNDSYSHAGTRDGTKQPGRSNARRRLKPEMRRAELLEAALAVLRSRDPADARVEDVTRAAGTAKGTFYLYFSSWNELLAALRDHLLSAYTAQVLERFGSVEASSDWWDTFEGECRRFVDFIVELGNLHKAIFHSSALEDAIDSEHSADRVISQLLDQGMALGACRRLHADTAAPLVFALLHTTADAISRFGEHEVRLETLLVLLRAWLRSPDLENEGER